MTLDGGESLRKSDVETREWFGLLPLSSIVENVLVLRSNIEIRLFSEEFPWPPYRFYIMPLPRS